MAKKKEDADLKRQIKEMEEKARAEAQAVSEVVVVAPESDEQPTVSFDQWWMMVGRKVKMRQHMKEILLVDFAARGLTKQETEQKYDDALRVFGIKW